MRDAQHYSRTIQKLYDHFNRREIAPILAHLHADIAWANGMEGGHVHGHDALADYWTRQWAAIVPIVNPVRIEQIGPEVVAVMVRQIVHDHAGKLLVDANVRHLFSFRDGLVTRFDIAEQPR